VLVGARMRPRVWPLPVSQVDEEASPKRLSGKKLNPMNHL